MPRVPESLAKSVVYLYRTKRAARTGEGDTGSGTAFVVAVFDGRSNLGFEYLVTCRHLVSTRTTCVRMNPRQPNASAILRRIQRSEWTFAPTDDLAVMRLRSPIRTADMDIEPFLMAVSLQRAECSPDNYGIGDDVFIVGRFVRAGREKVNVPTVRFGHISAMPGPPICYGGGHYRQPAFLVETSVIGGYSGSPAWVYRGDDAGYSDPGRAVPLGVRRYRTFSENTRLLGVVCAHFPTTGVAMVLPAWRVFALLNTPALVAARGGERKAIERIAKPRPRGSVRAAGASEDPSRSTPDSSVPPPSPGSAESPSPAS